MTTTTLTNQLSPSLLRSEIDERIALIRPSSTPLDQISRMIGARKANSMRVEYYSVDTKEGHDTVAKTVRDLILSHGQPFTVQVSNAAIFSETETVLLPSVIIPSGTYKGQALVGYISSIDGNELSLIPVNIEAGLTDISAGTIAEGASVIRMGRAARELDVQTAQFIALPRKDYNFCQIFKSQIEESLYQRLADKEVGWNITDQEEVAIMDMRMGMEKSFLFGARSRVCLGDTADEVLFTGGIWNQTDRTHYYDPAGEMQTEMLDIARAAFIGSSGSTRKILLAGSGLLRNLASEPNLSIISKEGKKTAWGIDFNVVHTRFGTLYVHLSEVFDLCGKPDSGIVIDPEYITKYVHVPFTADNISFRKQGVRNTEGIVLTEASCLVLRHPDTHLRLEPKQ